MCGIWCRIFQCINNSLNELAKSCAICENDPNHFPVDIEKMLSMHSRRGPDISTPRTEFQNQAATFFNGRGHVHLSGHVLWTQGPQPVTQPYRDSESQKFLLFNGDIYSFSGNVNEETFTPEKQNDGELLFAKLCEVEDDSGFLSVVSLLRGPFAFVFIDAEKGVIWFARDFFGRQSLIFSILSSESIPKSVDISSVCDNSEDRELIEIPAAGVYKLSTLGGTRITLFPFLTIGKSGKRDVIEKNVGYFAKLLDTIDIPFIIDKTGMPLTFPLALGFSDSDRDETLSRLIDLSKQGLTDKETLLKAAEIVDPFVTQFLQKLRKSIRLRLKAVAPRCKQCITNQTTETCLHPRIGVLFSGGVDSSVLAYLAAETFQGEIDLLNVAFSKDGESYDVPDRQTALQAFSALKEIFPNRFNLVLVNETRLEVEKMRKERIKDMISPLTSVIDDSVGCCLWFASRAKHSSTVRTVLLGSGADELLGGYSRHRSAFSSEGWGGLVSEMEICLDRISIRNMGRDNRIVSDHGLSPRMPYLDEEVVNFLNNECPLWVKCCPLLGCNKANLGQKLLLRAAAVKLLGPENASIALFPKRAMQFGSRIAKLENSKEKGGDVCDRLL